MAYNLDSRFPPPPKYFTLLDPGAYYSDKSTTKQNAAPFLSKAPRNTHYGGKLWTHAIYNRSIPHSIPNCTSLRSKQPRFPYEAFSAEDLEEILCRCGISSPCECPTGNETEEEIICQGKVRRRIFKGPTPRSNLSDEGLSTPSRKDHGFNVLNGYQYRVRHEDIVECPPFYDARVNEATAFYQGCKWSRRTSKRTPKSLEVRPGPADYFIEKIPNENEICAEKVRAFKRKTSKQPRFIEMVQRRNILEGRPGPTTYDPRLPKGTDLQFVGSKASRFPTSKYEVCPGPADHIIRRDFDPLTAPDKICHASLPEPPCFGTKANRFKELRSEGPSPASYDVNFKACNFIHCRSAPFDSSAKRFKEIIEESDEDETLENMEAVEKTNNEQSVKICPSPTWEFKSKTIRMKPSAKKSDEPSPADLPQPTIKMERSLKSQYIAPFFSSEARFQPWFSWIPIVDLNTPGPAEYRFKHPKCPPAVVHGPLSRAERFPQCTEYTPAPNEYNVNFGIETILATHNKRLKNNVQNQYKFHWEPPEEKKSLSFEEREQAILHKSINLLETDDTQTETAPVDAQATSTDTKTKGTAPIVKEKMLRTFLYATPVPRYF